MEDKSVRRRVFNKNQKSKQSAKLKAANTTSSNKSSSSLGLRLFLVFSAFVLAYFLIGAYQNSPVSMEITPDLKHVELTGKFAPNNKLQNSKKIVNLPGPESMVEDEFKNLYVGLADGRIVKIYPSNGGVIAEGNTETLTSGVIKGAAITTDDIPHGRPLGLRLRGNTLYVVDAIYGFYTVDIRDGKIKMLVTPDHVQPPMKFPNDLDISSDGNYVYFTDMSSKIPITRLAYLFLEGECSGRLFQYNVVTGRVKLLVTGLCSANGVQLSHDENTIAVAESTGRRVRIVEVGSWKTTNLLHLPFVPDNIRLSSGGSLWVAGGHILGPLARGTDNVPLVRKIMAGLFSPSALLSVLQQLVNFDHGLVCEFDERGHVIQTLHDPAGNTQVGMAQAQELSDGRLALGSYSSPHLAIVAGDAVKPLGGAVTRR